MPILYYWYIHYIIHVQHIGLHPFHSTNRTCKCYFAWPFVVSETPVSSMVLSSTCICDEWCSMFGVLTGCGELQSSWRWILNHEYENTSLQNVELENCVLWRLPSLILLPIYINCILQVLSIYIMRVLALSWVYYFWRQIPWGLGVVLSPCAGLFPQQGLAKFSGHSK